MELHTLGLKFKDEKKWEEVISTFLDAAKIREKRLPKTHIDLEETYLELASCYFDYRDYRQSIFYFQKVLQIEESLPTLNYDTLYTINDSLGRAYFNLQEYKEGISYCKKAAEIRQKHLTLDKSRLADALLSLANYEYTLGSYSSSIETAKEGLNALGTDPSENPGISSALYAILGSGYKETSQYEKAVESFNKSIELEIKQFGATNHILAAKYEALADIYLDMTILITIWECG